MDGSRLPSWGASRKIDGNPHACGAFRHRDMKYEVPFSWFRIRFAFLAHVHRACAFLFLLGFSQIAGFSRITWRLLWFKPAPMRLFDIGGIKSMQASVASVHIVEHPRLAHRAHFHLVGPFLSLCAA